MNPHVDTVETPAVLVDRDRLGANIAAMQAKATRDGVALHPHGKTHKCPRIAAMQMAAGATGLTVSKSEEAVAFLRGGVPLVTIAYPLVERRKVLRVLETAAEHAAAVRFVVDSDAGLDALAGAGERSEPLPVLIEIDVGLGRCGLRADEPALPDLALRIARTPGLVFAGLLSHAGHAYGAGDLAGVRAVAREEVVLLEQARGRLAARGLAVPRLSVGSTPTVAGAESFAGVDEVRPGNYVFMDLTQVRLGVARIEEVALSVLATVVSSRPGTAVIDAGSKVLSSDTGPHGTGGGGFGRAWPAGVEPGSGPGIAVTRLSEEHGFLATGDGLLPVGTRLRILPNHACPVANLADRLLAFDGDGIEEWPVTARGMVR